MSTELPPLPQPFEYCYEWDGPYGKRKFTPAPHNGRSCDRGIALYTADQVQAYALAASAPLQAQVEALEADAQRSLEERIAMAVDQADFEWRPIETAPKDNKARLVWCPERQNIYCVSWHGDWLLFGGGGSGWLTERPTHWCELPAPPAAMASAAQEG